MKKIFLKTQISNSPRPPLAASNELLERAPVEDGQAAAPHSDDACLSPDRKLLTHDLARDAQHSGQFHLRNIESRGWLGFLAWLVSLDQRDYLFGQPSGYAQESRILEKIGGPPQAGTKKSDDANHCLGPRPKEGQQIIAPEEEQLRRLVSYRRRTAPFAIQQGNFAEELAGIVLVEDQLLALLRLDDNKDTSGQNPIEAIARVVFAKHDLARRNTLDERKF
jgi:hypothetical protein